MLVYYCASLPFWQTTSMAVSIVVLVLLPSIRTPLVDSLAIPLPFSAADALATHLPLLAAADTPLDAAIMATSTSPSPPVAISALLCVLWPCGNDLAARVTLRGKEIEGRPSTEDLHGIEANKYARDVKEQRRLTA